MTMNTNQCIAAWSNNEGRPGFSGKSGGAVRFDGKTLFSYETPIAEFHRTPSGGKVVLISSEKYSATTSKHISRVRYEARQWTCIKVPTVFDGTSKCGRGYPLNHVVNISYLRDEASDNLHRYMQAFGLVEAA
jgi:hypothetical protein